MDYMISCFLHVINAAMFGLVGWFLDGFTVQTF